MQAQSWEIKRVAILHGDEGVLRLSAGAEMDGRAAMVAQLQVAGDEVGVEMGEEDVADLEAKLFGVGQVLLDVALRVDDDGGCALLVPEQIGGVRQASEVVLFQNHGSRPSLTRPRSERKRNAKRKPVLEKFLVRLQTYHRRLIGIIQIRRSVVFVTV